MNEPSPAVGRLAGLLGHATTAAFAADRVGQGSEGRLSLLDWGRRYLPGHFAKPPSALHRWLAEELDAMRTVRGRRLNLVGPRGSAKSTIASLAFVLRAVVEGEEPYVWIVSDTKSQARAHLENVKAELLENRRIAEDYGPVARGAQRWNATALRLRSGVTVEAYGAGQRIRGRRSRENRPTLIVCDDLQNERHGLSSRLRESFDDWFFGTLLPAGTKRTNVVNVGTAVHRDAIAMRLGETPGSRSRTFRSIVAWPERDDLRDEWAAIYNARDEGASTRARRFYAEHRAAMDAGAEVLWPDEEDLYTLMRMRAESGAAAFEREKQSSPSDPNRCEWPEEYFDESAWFDDWPRDLTLRTIALDPSKGADATHGDYSAIVMLGIDADGMVYVEADLQRRPTPQMVADGVVCCERFRPDVFGVEANQWQQLLAGEFLAEFARRGLVGVAPCELNNHAPKPMRIRRLGPYLAQRRIRFRRDSAGTRLLVEQLRDFPLAGHDDGPDALEMALRLAEEVWRERGELDE